MHIHRRTADVAGHTRRFIVIQPEELGPQPDLLLFFHGSQQSANVLRRFTNGTVDALADATNTLVVYPDGIDHHFNDTRANLPVRARELGVDDVAFSTFLIETMQREYATARTFAAGYSNGGQMVLRLLFDAPGLLTGAATFGASKASMADKDEAQRVTGYVLGGVSPLGQKKALPTVIDEAAELARLSDESIFFSGGKRGLEIEMAPADFIALTGARIAGIATH